MKNLNVKRAALTAVAIVLSLFVLANLTLAQNAASAYPPGPSGQAPTLNATQVVVTNTAAQPVPVVGAVVSVPQGTPVQIKLTAQFGFDDSAPKATYSIPAGKRLVIEHVATMCSSNLGIAVAQTAILHVGTSLDSSLTWINVSAVPYLVQGAYRTVGATATPMHANLDGGEVWVEGIRSVSNQGMLSCEVAILGYLVNAPAQIN